MPIYEHNPYESVGRCKQLGGLFERRAARGSSRSFQGGSAPLPFKFGGLEPPPCPRGSYGHVVESLEIIL